MHDHNLLILKEIITDCLIKSDQTFQEKLIKLITDEYKGLIKFWNKTIEMKQIITKCFTDTFEKISVN